MAAKSASSEALRRRGAAKAPHDQAENQAPAGCG
jgi:hypothetical protein